MSTPENLPQVFEDDSIDLIALLKQIYQGRKLIILSAFVAAILGVVVALTTPNTYTSVVTFIPQSGGDSKPSSSLSGLASLAGISLGGMGGGSDIPPTLYPKIISSIPFRLDLLEQPVKVSGNEVRLADYLTKNSGSSVFETFKNYTVGLPRRILNNIPDFNTSNQLNFGQFTDIYEVTRSERILFSILKAKLVISLNIDEGFITIKFTDNNKFIAAQVAERAKELLQERIIAFKNQSARELLDFTTKQYQENKTSYEALQDSIAIFKDQNLNISSSLYQNRLDRLERELNIASSVVEQLASQVEQAKLQVNKDTPVFTIIEPVTVPFERSAPKRSLIVVIWTFLGVVLSIGFVLVKDPAKEIIASIRE